MPTTSIHDGTTFQPIQYIYLKDNVDTWQFVKKAWVYDGATWQLVFTSQFVYNETISVNTANYNLRNQLTTAGWDGTQDVTATITVNPGVTVYSTSTPTGAFTVSPALPAGSAVTLINNGTIVGKGGAGGAGGDSFENFTFNEPVSVVAPTGVSDIITLGQASGQPTTIPALTFQVGDPVYLSGPSPVLTALGVAKTPTVPAGTQSINYYIRTRGPTTTGKSITLSPTRGGAVTNLNPTAVPGVTFNFATTRETGDVGAVGGIALKTSSPMIIKNNGLIAGGGGGGGGGGSIYVITQRIPSAGSLAIANAGGNGGGGGGGSSLSPSAGGLAGASRGYLDAYTNNNNANTMKLSPNGGGNAGNAGAIPGGAGGTPGNAPGIYDITVTATGNPTYNATPVTAQASGGIGGAGGARGTAGGAGSAALGTYNGDAVASSNNPLAGGAGGAPGPSINGYPFILLPLSTNVNPAAPTARIVGPRA